MTMKKPIGILAVALLAALPALAQKHYTEIEYPPLKDFVIPEAQRVELENGMVVFLIEDRELPLIGLSARIGGGAAQEAPDKVGLASVTGTVMRTGGTHTMTGDALNERLESIAASVETSIGSISGSVSMSTLAEHVDEVLAIVADVLRNPAFPQDKIDLAVTQEKSAVSRRNDNAQGIAYREFDELIYGSDHPFARSTEYSTLDAITRDDLVDFHGTFFHPNNVILGVWGDFDTDAMTALVEKHFGDWPKAEGFTRPKPPEMPAITDYGVNLVEKDDVTQSSILLGHAGELTYDHPDYGAVRVMNQVLSGGFSSRLFQNVRDDQGLAYAVFGSYTGSYDRPGQFYAGVMTKSESTVEAARSVLREVEMMRKAPPTDEEMTQAKDSYLNSFVFRFDTRREIVSRVMTYEYYDYPLDFIHDVKSGIEAATAADVHRVSEKYLKPDRVQILAVGNSDDFGEPLSVLGPVNEIDITIPTGSEAPEATEETLDQGRAVLAEVIEALGGQSTFDAIESVRYKLSVVITTPDNQEISMEMDHTYVFPDRVRIVQRLPMGEFVITKDGDAFTFPDMWPESMHSGIKAQITSALWRDLAYLIARSDQVDVQYLGEEALGDTMAEILAVTPPGGSDFSIYVDTESRRPLALGYATALMGIGPELPTTEMLSDYRDVGDGLMLPFRSQAEGLSVTVESVEVNSGVEEGWFE